MTFKTGFPTLKEVSQRRFFFLLSVKGYLPILLIRKLKRLKICGDPSVFSKFIAFNLSAQGGREFPLPCTEQT